MGAFAAPSNTTVARFYALFDSTSAEAVSAFAQDWSGNVLFILPDFHRTDRILDKAERDDAEMVMVVRKRTPKR